MPRYRKLPVEVTAIQFTGDNIDEVVKFIPNDKDIFVYIDYSSGKEMHNIKTREGQVSFQKGDYIIIGVENEIYPCCESVFKKTYELVKEC